MENYNNIILISADRNGSTAFQEGLKIGGPNGDTQIFLGECFSQDPVKNQPPLWHNPTVATPKDMVETVNKLTGKPVLIKIQITYPNFTKEYLEIPASQKIFLHRNLFDSTLSRCIAQQTGKWWWYQESNVDSSIIIPPEFFLSRLHWRIEQYTLHIDNVLEWTNKIYRYEDYNYSDKIALKPNKDKKQVVKNYSKLYNLFLKEKNIEIIENKICSKIT